MLHIGIDPGTKGALVALDLDLGTMAAYNLPILVEEHATTVKNVVHAVEFDNILDELRVGEVPCEVHFEDVFSMASDGHVGAFTFGQNKGALTALIRRRNVPLHFISPSRWKQEMGCTSDKWQTRRVAQALFPDAHTEMTNEGKHEAALIALWGLLSRTAGEGAGNMRFKPAAPSPARSRRKRKGTSASRKPVRSRSRQK